MCTYSFWPWLSLDSRSLALRSVEKNIFAKNFEKSGTILINEIKIIWLNSEAFYLWKSLQIDQLITANQSQISQNEELFIFDLFLFEYALWNFSKCKDDEIHQMNVRIVYRMVFRIADPDSWYRFNDVRAFVTTML